MLCEKIITQGVLTKRWKLTIKEQIRRRNYELEEGACCIGPKAEGEEEWRDVVGYEGLYRVSNFGRIFKIWQHGGGFMKMHKRSSGYYSVSLTKERGKGKQRIRFAHRLVAHAFIPGYMPGLVVNHKDFNPGNNRVANLEWVTPGRNVEYSRLAGRYPAFTASLPGESNPRAILTEGDVRLIKNKIAAGYGNTEIGRIFGVCGAAIYRIKKGKNWKHVV